MHIGMTMDSLNSQMKKRENQRKKMNNKEWHDKSVRHHP